MTGKGAAGMGRPRKWRVSQPEAGNPAATLSPSTTGQVLLNWNDTGA